MLLTQIFSLKKSQSTYETYQKVHALQFAWGMRSLFQNNEENVVFTKTKGPFSLNVKF